MLIEGIRHPERCIGRGHLGGVASFDLLYATLDLANIFKIVGQSRAITRSKSLLQTRCFLGNRIQNAALLLDPLLAFLKAARLPEDSLEGSPGIGLHGKRRRR